MKMIDALKEEMNKSLKEIQENINKQCVWKLIKPERGNIINVENSNRRKTGNENFTNSDRNCRVKLHQEYNKWKRDTSSIEDR